METQEDVDLENGIEISKEDQLANYPVEVVEHFKGKKSNGVYYVRILGDGDGIAKPRSEESALQRSEVKCGTYYLRERAAFLVSRDLGFDLVPETVIRHLDGYGPASLQSFVDDATTAIQLGLRDEGSPVSIGVRYPELVQPFKDMQIFDYIIYNSDRHDGNFLIQGRNRLFAIDNSLSFGHDYLTIFLENDEPPSEEVVKRLGDFLGDMDTLEFFKHSLENLIKEDEIDALINRIRYVYRCGIDKKLINLSIFNPKEDD